MIDAGTVIITLHPLRRLSMQPDFPRPMKTCQGVARDVAYQMTIQKKMRADATTLYRFCSQNAFAAQHHVKRVRFVPQCLPDFCTRRRPNKRLSCFFLTLASGYLIYRVMQQFTLSRASNPHKYLIVNDQTGHRVRFGAKGYQDFTQHHDQERKRSYLRRHAKDSRSLKKAGFWARSLLWNQASLKKSIAHVQRQRGIKIKTTFKV